MALSVSLFCVRDLYFEVVQAQVQPKDKLLQVFCFGFFWGGTLRFVKLSSQSKKLHLFSYC